MCGIIGLYSQTPVNDDLYNGMIHLQHRGQDAAGMITFNSQFHLIKGRGFVKDVFTQESLETMQGCFGLGHTRYPTTGSAYDVANAQPFFTNYPYGISMVHNGNLVNYKQLKLKLIQEDKFYCNSGSDMEVILGIFALSLLKNTDLDATISRKLSKAVKDVLEQASGGYSVISFIAGIGMVAFRDPHGIRPLVFGTRPAGNGKTDYLFASETGMFNALGFEYFDDVEAGEMVYVDMENNLHRIKLKHKQFTPCAFEYIYFARPDAYINKVSVYRARLRMGENLAKKWLQNYPDQLPDVVIPVPFSANTAALSMAQNLGVRYTEGLYKNPFVGRTFIMADQESRRNALYRKLTPQEFEIKDKVVMLVDDSIVRGTTSQAVIDMVRKAGAKKIYFVSASPEIRYPDFYGIDIASKGELLADGKTVDQIRQFIGADLLMYQDIDDLFEAITRKGSHTIDQLSMPWFDGKYITGDINFPTLKPKSIDNNLIDKILADNYNL